MKYKVFESDSRDGFAVLKYLENVENSYDIKKGKPFTGILPSDACFRMNEEYPKDIKVPDCFGNLDSMIVISKRLVETIAAYTDNMVEFLPVKIYNHKGRETKEPFFILNPLTVVDCIDKEKSDISWNCIDPERISSCMELVLIDDALTNAPPLIRLKYATRVILIREDLAEILENGNFSGIWLVDIEEAEF